jgi:hypothetical protein
MRSASCRRAIGLKQTLNIDVVSEIGPAVGGDAGSERER